MTEPSPVEGLTDTGAARPEEDLQSLVGDWYTMPDLAERLHLPVTRVRRLIQDRVLLGVRPREPGPLQVPVAFLTDEGPMPQLRGTFTVLADGGMSDVEIIRWLFTPDPTLPTPGAPIDALRAGHKTEVRRRAMELAF